MMASAASAACSVTMVPHLLSVLMVLNLSQLPAVGGIVSQCSACEAMAVELEKRVTAEAEKGLRSLDIDMMVQHPTCNMAAAASAVIAVRVLLLAVFDIVLVKLPPWLRVRRDGSTHRASESVRRFHIVSPSSGPSS